MPVFPLIARTNGNKSIDAKMRHQASIWLQQPDITHLIELESETSVILRVNFWREYWTVTSYKCNGVSAAIWIFVQQFVHANNKENTKTSITGGFTSQRISNAENFSVPWSHQ